VLAAKGIKSVEGVEWFELGMPEAIWILNAEHFGPLTVAIDSHGGSLFAQVNAKVKENEPKARRSSVLAENREGPPSYFPFFFSLVSSSSDGLAGWAAIICMASSPSPAGFPLPPLAPRRTLPVRSL